MSEAFLNVGTNYGDNVLSSIFVCILLIPGFEVLKFAVKYVIYRCIKKNTDFGNYQNKR
jgi:hypothetical protein